MGRLVLYQIGLAAILLPLSFALPARAQLRIYVPAQRVVNLRTKIHPRVENAGETPVTYCVEFGQWSPINGAAVESTPIPFVAERDSGGVWRPLLIGPDVGSSRHPVVLDGGRSYEYPFVLLAAGRLRVVLTYWPGSKPSLDCSKPPEGARKVRSAPFVVNLLLEEY